VDSLAHEVGAVGAEVTVGAAVVVGIGAEEEVPSCLDLGDVWDDPLSESSEWRLT
jgi:hypothetical protein